MMLWLDTLEEGLRMALGDVGRRVKDSVKGVVGGVGDVVEAQPMRCVGRLLGR